jgi:hypothetical protein
MDEEKALLLDFLESERGHVLRILDGLSAPWPDPPSRDAILLSDQDWRSKSLSSASMST